MTEGQLLNIYDNDPFNFMTPYEYIPPVDIKTEPYIPETAHGPYIQIIEEPKQRGFRFRYECEGPSHGGLPGASSEKNRRTYPTVKISNYVGHARVEVQLVTHTDPPRVHAHSLVGRHCNESGTCTLDIGPNDLTASFSNLGILHVTKKGVVEILCRRLKEEKRRQKGAAHFHSDTEEGSCMKEAKELGRTMDLNIVRLKFTAFLQDSNGGFTRALKPVVSNPIYDSKSPNASNLKITRMDKTCGSVLGGDEIFLLCDKVQKDDIEIRFYEDDEGGWEAFGDFSPTDVHKQYAIVFKTPPYHSTEIERPVTVFLQLKRKKAGDRSDPKHFTYIPQVQDKEEVLRKKQKPLPHYENWRGGGRGGGAEGFGGGASGAGGGGGFQFCQHMNGGGSFSMGGFSGFSGGAQMSSSSSSSHPQSEENNESKTNQTGQTNAILQQRLFQLAVSLQTKASQSARQMAAALLQYCSSGDVRLLLSIQRHLCGVQDSNGDTPLHLAVIHQQNAVIQQLLQTLGNGHQHLLNTANHLRKTPLHLAVSSRQMQVVELLLRAGADPSLVDRDGRSAVHLAALSGDTSVLRTVLTHLTDEHAPLVNAPDYHGLQPLHLSVRRDGERCLRLLVESGAKINAPEQKSGCTALHLAVTANLFKVACILITEVRDGLPHTLLHAHRADKNLENDEPLYFSSSDEEPDEGDEEQTVSVSQPTNPLKRRAGHTALDLATCQKVRPLRRSLRSRVSGLDSDTLTRLMEVVSVQNIPWKKLAEKLGMMTLTPLYENSPSPCVQLLQHYQLGGGAVEGLVEAFRSLGVSEGVRLLRDAQPREDKHNTDTTVDSGFGSQAMEEEEEPVAS
uniref:RHD domain-containing protein n=1 Tax=Periophthalmus magnuspinnatus TaxID=409849 RepID=A0A3B4A445_9GOBI